jgi:hypothetical protein
LSDAAQAWHTPLQAVSQHTPSRQFSLAHSVPAVHATPFALRQRALCAWQAWPGEQWAFVLHMVRQLPSVQVYSTAHA